MGSSDMLIVGGIIVIGGALLFYPDVFSNIIPPASGGGVGGGEFLDGSGGGGEFTVEDTPNPTGSCKSKYNGKCRSECATDKYSARCQECISLCGGGKGCSPGHCYSVGANKCVLCGSTANQCRTLSDGTYCLCASNVAGNKVRDNRPFRMGASRTCTDCTVYCKTGVAPNISPGTTPGTVGVTPPGRVYPKRISSNCTQVAAATFRWMSSGKSSDGKSCDGARSAWCRRWTSNNCGQSSGGSTGGPRPAPKPVTSTLCKCGSGRAKHVLGDCSACKRVCSRTCGRCSPQCLGTRTNVGYFEDAAEDYFDTGLRFSNMAMAI